jgi:hypothetical protein
MNMPEDFDKSVDETVARALAVVEQSSALLAQAETGMRDFAALKEANGIRPETHEKVYGTLSDGDKAKMRDEQERFDIELKHDIDAALARAEQPKTRPAGAKRTRNFV